LKWLSYSWSAFAGLVELAVALAVVTRFNEPFERVVVDLLVIGYVTVRMIGLRYAVVSIENAGKDQNRFIALLKAAGEDPLWDEDNRKLVQHDGESVRESIVTGAIRAVLLWLVWLAAVVNLLDAM